jgi:hypothetical protein
MVRAGRSVLHGPQRAITGALGRLGFDVRVAEDMSLRHLQQALPGWHRLLRVMQANQPGPR